MRIHHLNCISTCPIGGRLMDGRTHGLLRRARLCCHCLLIETAHGLVLVDTGFGTGDVARPQQRLSLFFRGLLAPDLRASMTALGQIQALGWSPADVRHIVLTHLDFDHAGGIDDFPDAVVHVMADEMDVAGDRTGWLRRQRFRPQQWARDGGWRLHRQAAGETWLGLPCVRALEGLPPEILMVPLPGHTLGHAGVAIQSGGRWHLLAGDAYFHQDELALDRRRCPPGLRAYQWMMEQDRAQRQASLERVRDLRGLHASGQLEIFCSHDVAEFERVAARRFDLPAAP